MDAADVLLEATAAGRPVIGQAGEATKTLGVAQEKRQLGVLNPYSPISYGFPDENELENTDDNDRRFLDKDLNDLMRKTPRTELAQTRFRRIWRNMTGEAKELVKSVVGEIVTESARKAIFGS